MFNQAIIFDKSFETNKGTLRVCIDLGRVITDISNYADKLMMARNIPFDIQNSSPADPMVLLASQLMSNWIDDPKEIIVAVRRYYEQQAARCQSDGGIVAFTRLTPPLDFEPEPYSEAEPVDDWDMPVLPEPVRNLRNPVERRLKQIYDALASDPVVSAQFYNSAESIFVEVERRSRKLDEDGFQPGRSGGDLHAEAGSRGRKPKVRNSNPGLRSLPGRDGHSESEAGVESHEGTGSGVSGEDPR